MDRLVEIVKLGFLIAVVVLVVGLYPYFDAKTRDNCEAINTGRRAASIRANILKQFITDAANARETSANREIKSGQIDAAASDFATAAKYRALTEQIEVVPEREC